MNSIESYSPPTLVPLDSENIGSEVPLPDPELLALLRSMMGGVAPVTSMPSPADIAPSVSTAAQSQGDSAEMMALIASIQASFSAGADVADPHVVDQMKSLLDLLNSDSAGSPVTVPAQTVLSSHPSEIISIPTSAESGEGAVMPGSSLTSTGMGASGVDQSIPMLLQAFVQATTDQGNGHQGVPSASQGIRAELVKALAEATSAPRASSQSEAHAGPDLNTGSVDEMAGLGNSILSSIGQQSSTSIVNAPGATAPAMTAERVEQVSTLMSQMADRVLVTDPLHGQTAEVRIKLADNLIPGTEVRVWREQGQLHVSFDTTSAYWARVLNEASPLLSQRLQERLPNIDPAQVTVFHQGGQPEDGRSRNRHAAWEQAQQAMEA